MDAPSTSLSNRCVELVGSQPLSGAHALLTFRHPEVAQRARAGQFVMIKAGTSPDPPLRRPFSVMDVDASRGTFSLFLKAIGPGSRALRQMRPGDLALSLGPLGRPFSPPPEGVEPVIVAGGYGIAPFVLFAKELQRAGRTARVFYGGRAAADVPLVSLFEGLGAELVPVTEDGSLGERGRVTEPLEPWLAGRGPRVALYACGPEPMLRAVDGLAARLRLRAQLSLDPWMGCGFGVCLGCVVRIQEAHEPRPRYRCACTEGPVFDAETVVWEGELRSRAGLDREGA